MSSGVLMGMTDNKTGKRWKQAEESGVRPALQRQLLLLAAATLRQLPVLLR